MIKGFVTEDGITHMIPENTPLTIAVDIAVDDARPAEPDYVRITAKGREAIRRCAGDDPLEFLNSMWEHLMPATNAYGTGVGESLPGDPRDKRIAELEAALRMSADRWADLGDIIKEAGKYENAGFCYATATRCRDFLHKGGGLSA